MAAILEGCCVYDYHVLCVRGPCVSSPKLCVLISVSFQEQKMPAVMCLTIPWRSMQRQGRAGCTRTCACETAACCFYVLSRFLICLLGQVRSILFMLNVARSLRFSLSCFACAPYACSGVQWTRARRKQRRGPRRQAFLSCPSQMSASSRGGGEMGPCKLGQASGKALGTMPGWRLLRAGSAVVRQQTAVERCANGTIVACITL